MQIRVGPSIRIAPGTGGYPTRSLGACPWSTGAKRFRRTWLQQWLQGSRTMTLASTLTLPLTLRLTRTLPLLLTPNPTPNPNSNELRCPSLHPASLSVCYTPSLSAAPQMLILYLLLLQRCCERSTPSCSPVATIYPTLIPNATHVHIHVHTIHPTLIPKVTSSWSQKPSMQCCPSACVVLSSEP